MPNEVKLLPCIPTPEMIAAAWTVIDREKKATGVAKLGPGLGVREIWQAMFDASRPTTLVTDEVVERVAIGDIRAERERQMSAEGWTPEHDDTHGDNALARAAACYAVGSIGLESAAPDSSERGWYCYKVWPWSREWWKPSDRRRDLVKAGALIVAEIEHLDRAALARAAIASMPTVVTGEQPQDLGDHALPCSARSPVSRSRPKAAAAIARKDDA